tara:strand:+ start:61 stop:246 length:186 start_codon:yes stop_codon:yes gene_type:complete
MEFLAILKIFGGLAVIFGLGALINWLERKYCPSREINVHHDHRPGSYYYESQRALREARRR